MSLDPRDSHRRGRSRSPGARERQRSTSRADARAAPVMRYQEEEEVRGLGGWSGAGSGRGSEYEERARAVYADPTAMRPEVSTGLVNSGLVTSGLQAAPGGGVAQYAVPGTFAAGGRRGFANEYQPEGGYGLQEGRYREDVYQYTDPRGSNSQFERERAGERMEPERAASFNLSAGRHSVSGSIALGKTSPVSQSPYPRPPSPPSALAYGEIYEKPQILGRQYAEVKKWEYAQPDENIVYKRRDEDYSRPASPPQQQYDSTRPRHNSKSLMPGGRSEMVVTVEPGSRRRDASPNPQGLGGRMHSLSLSTGHHGGGSMTLANAPGSPLLEAYHGTYQSISPMPSPIMRASPRNEAIEAFSLSDDEVRSPRRRTARFHDPEEEARTLARALSGDKHAPNTDPLVDILPGLTHDQVMDLRVEYKKIVKTGSERKGVNIAKHVRSRLKDEDPSLREACYACALGKWESEAHWANFWYQGEKSRRELLIESLFGRTNGEIEEIMAGFADKKYSNSLVKCMERELKEDKFKKAVLLVLSGKRMEESRRVDGALVEDDVRDLYKAVRSERGGETRMIEVVVGRSATHMREVLRAYQERYRSNFAREMLKKSGNLVGELLAHILNGVINAPVRDALLVQHALSLSKGDGLRTELLTSRLVRYHWDRTHMEGVKREYRARYGVEMQVAVREGTRGEWGRFMEGLCLKRVPDEVVRF